MFTPVIKMQPFPEVAEYAVNQIAFIMEMLMWSNAFKYPQKMTSSGPTNLMHKHYGKHTFQTGFKLYQLKK